MKLITWIVALYNRKWQRRFDALMLDVEPEEKPNELDDDTDFMMEVMDNQPTHLSRKFKARDKRRNRKEVKQYGR